MADFRDYPLADVALVAAVDVEDWPLLRLLVAGAPRCELGGWRDDYWEVAPGLFPPPGLPRRLGMP